jgi:16S rRNA (guanine527-N7)-methyltransferase
VPQLTEEPLDQHLEKELRRGLDELGLQCSEQEVRKLLNYLQLLEKWNSSFNLSGIADIESMLSRHLLDSLSLHSHLSGNCFADVGTGAGLPGIPLAILNPKKHFALIDSNGKKTRFLFHVKTVLSLENISIVNCRIEHYQSPQQIDMVMSRAFSSLADLAELTRHLLAPGCRLLAMKGRYPEQEIESLPDDFEVTRVEKLEIPGDETQRHLIELIRK